MINRAFLYNAIIKEVFIKYLDVELAWEFILYRARTTFNYPVSTQPYVYPT